MKLADFRDLCQQAWREDNSEILTLWLTQESYRELQEEAARYGALQQHGISRKDDDGVSRPASRTIWNPQGTVSTQVGIQARTLVNPVTKNPVRMKLSQDRDVADVYDGKTGQLVTRLL